MGVELVGVYGRLFRACSGRFFAIGHYMRLSEGNVVLRVCHILKICLTKGLSCLCQISSVHECRYFETVLLRTRKTAIPTTATMTTAAPTSAVGGKLPVAEAVGGRETTVTVTVV